MAKLEPFKYGIALPREDSLPCLSLSIAAMLEEPDLSFRVTQGYARGFLADEERLTLQQLRKEQALVESDDPGLVVARVVAGGTTTFGLYCRYPLKQIEDLERSYVCADDGGAYERLLAANKVASLESLLLAIPGLNVDLADTFAHAYETAAQYGIADGVSLELRTITGKKEIRAALKQFEPGIFGAWPDVFVLDGPIARARALHAKGEEYVFACLVPLRESGARLTMNELLVTGASGELPLPGEAKLRTYPYIDDEEREYVGVDWTEDLRIESQTADVCALLRRERKELAMVVGTNAQRPREIDRLFCAHAFGAEAKREVLPRGERAARVFLAGEGDIALWTPQLDRTQADLLARRPSLEARRAMLGLEASIPFGCVIETR